MYDVGEKRGTGRYCCTNLLLVGTTRSGFRSATALRLVW
jgi:hypothetical protein